MDQFQALFIFLGFGHFLPDRAQQAFGLEFIQGIAGGFKMVCQSLGQPLIERGVFHVDDDGAEIPPGNLLGELVGFFLRGQNSHGDVTGSIGEDDQQRFHIRVDELFLRQYFIGHQHSRRQRRFPSHGDIRQGALGECDRIGGRQDESGPVLLEDDQPHAVAALVGIGQKGQDGALGGSHAFRDSHGPGSIHQEQDQIGGLFDADFPLQVALLDGESHLFTLLGALRLEGRGGAQGRIESHVVSLAVGGAGLDVTAAFALGVRARAAAGMLAG